MNKSALGLCALVALFTLVPLWAQSAPPAPKYVSGQLLVKFRANTRPAAVRAAHLAVAGNVVDTFNGVEGLQLVRIPASMKLSAALATYRANPQVQYAEPDYIVHSFQTPTDPLFPSMWSLLNNGQSGGTIGADIKAAQAWNLTTGSSNVIVAVIDSGVDYTHPDLAANIFSGPICPGGVVCHGITSILGSVLDPNDPFDDNGHGTHVSGTIGAIGNNSLGVTGINWNVTILPCKFLNADGAGATSDAIKCLDFIKSLKDTQGLNIVASNNSWGGTEFSQALEDAIDRQRQSGILFIAAAGNDFADNDVLPTYPASFPLPNIISVAATDRNDHRSFFSNIGRHTVHIGAPGQDILSTLPGGTYGIESGTSMATPHVTGVAALLAAQDSTRDWRAIKNLILAGGDPDPDLAATITGRRLNAFSALTCVNSLVSGRLAPVTNTVSASVGVPLVLSALNINCAQPAGPVQVTVAPGGQTITLTDDGVSADLSAGDGVYTGSFTPSASGVYILTYSTGDVVAVQVLNNYQPATATFNYRPITGTNLNLGDDDVAQVTSPFPIAFADGSFTELWVSANGTISFSGAFSTYVHEFIPTAAPFSQATVQASTLVAPFWDDLLPLPGTQQNVFWDVTGTAPNRELVVEWRDVRAFACAGEPDSIRFQVVFFENSSNVLFNYADAVFGGSCIDHDRGGSASAGIQVSSSLGTLFGRDGQFVTDGTALLWQTSTTPLPPPLDPTITSISPAAVDAYGPDFVLTINGSGFQPGAHISRSGAFDRVTTFVSSTQLEVLLPASDIDLFKAFSNTESFGVQNPGAPAPVQNGLWPTLTINNPAHPVITGFNPTTTPGNQLSFLLDVIGNDFSPSSTVTWNGQTLQFVRFGSRTHIQAIVPGALAVPGTALVQIVNPLPGGGLSPGASFIVGPPGPPVPFAGVAPATINIAPHGPASMPPASSGPPRPPFRFLGWNHARSMGADYFNHFIRPYAPGFTTAGENKLHPGDSAPSSAIATSISVSLPGLLLNNATPTGFIPTSIAVGDFNRDGHPDYVVANGGSNDLWVYLGNGDGTFQNPRIIQLSGQTPAQVLTADLRGIGILDLIVAEPDSLSIGVLLGAGDGAFGPETLYVSPGPPLSIAIADFNGDGHQDVVAGIIGSNNSGPLVFFSGDGAGHLTAPLFTPSATNFEFPFVSAQLSVSDFDKDGFPDLLVTDCCVADFAPGVTVYRNQHDGTFKAKPQVLASDPDIPFFYLNAAAGDMNKDGCPDLVANNSFGLAAVMLGNCDGTFRAGPAPVQFASGDIAANIALADVNGDGNLDLINSAALLDGGGPGGQSGQLVAISPGDGTGALAPPHVIRVETNLFALAVADLNGDLHPDIVVASQDADSVSTLINDGLGNFPGPQGGYVGWNESGAPFSNSINAPGVSYVADLNGDGKPDLFYADFPFAPGLPTNVAVALNDGTGRFGNDIKSPILDSSSAFVGNTISFGNMIAGDFRNTGHPDLIVVPDQVDPGFSAPIYNFLPGLGNGHFDRPITNLISHVTGTLASGDFNGDGKLDFVMLGFGGLSTFLGNGDGTFRELPLVALSIGSPFQVFTGDVNGDGKLDILASLDSGLMEFLGHGDGTFSAGFLAIPGPGDFSVTDLNHDGRLDAILRTADPTPPFVPLFKIYLGQPDGSMTLQNTYSPYTGGAVTPVNGQNQSTSSFTGDYNGDGNIDIAAFQKDSLAGSFVQILLGNGDGTFTPTFEKLPLGARGFQNLPTLNADVNGDGKSDFIELDGFTSAFNVITSSVGHPFQLQFSALPIVGNTGAVQMTLSAAAPQDTVFQLSTSDPNITVPSSITVPAGSVSASATVTVSPAFDVSRTFTVTATDSLNSSSALASIAVPGKGVGFLASAGTQLFNALLPGQSSSDIGFSIASRGGYKSTVNAACSGLPTGVTCQFGSTSLQLQPGGFAGTPLILNVTSPLPVGDYTFNVIASDVSITQSVPVTFHVGDVAVQLNSQSGAALSTGFETFQLTATSVNHFFGVVNVACSGLPAGATCLTGNTIVGGGVGGPSSVGVGVNTSALAVGDYPFAITADTGFTRHSVNAVLHVGDIGTGSVNPPSATISVGQSATFGLSVASVNGFNDTLTFFCSPSVNGVGVSGINCSFSPVRASFDASGKLTDQITVTATARPRGTHLGRLAGVSRLPWYAPLALTLAFAAVFAASPRKRKKTFMVYSITLMMFSLMVACGGGGGSGSGGGNPGVTPTPTPTPTPSGPQTVNIDVFATSQTQFQAPSRKVATFSVIVQ